MRFATNRRTFASSIPTLVGALCVLVLSGFGCRDSAPDDVIVEEETTAAIVFVKTVGEETLNRSWAEGNLYKLSPISPDGIVTPITNFTGASVSDPCVSFDGTKILFSMRPPTGGNRNIYEINADGTGLRQVTTGGGHDFDPLYLPDDRIMFTSSRAREMDEYNHAPVENMYVVNADGSNLQRVSFNMSDDFDPTLNAEGHVVYTRWEHFGTVNRFPLFVANPDGTAPFHKYGPHNRNFFHAQPTPDGRLVAIESTMIEEDAGPIAVLKLEAGPADPTQGSTEDFWNVLTPQVNTDGEPWPYGAFKYPSSLGGNTYVVSYTLPAALESDVDYGLYTFTLNQTGAGTGGSPATISIDDLTFLYNDPNFNEYDAQLLAPRARPPVIPSTVDLNRTDGVILANTVFNRALNDGQEVPIEGATGVDAIDSVMVIVGIPTLQGEPNDFSANEFEKRAILGFAPVNPDGSFRIRVPANTPISWATLDGLNRSFVAKRTWLYMRPGEEITKCAGCHQDRMLNQTFNPNPNPTAASLPPTDLNIPPSGYRFINYRDHIGPLVEANCVSCHQPTYTTDVPPDTIPPAGDLDLTAVPDTTMEDQVFPRGYINLSGESEMGPRNVTVPAFSRRSPVIDYLLGVDEGVGKNHDTLLNASEKEMFNLWVILGAQYR
jgi:mono/diheme cytochrome c family protein